MWYVVKGMLRSSPSGDPDNAAEPAFRAGAGPRVKPRSPQWQQPMGHQPGSEVLARLRLLILEGQYGPERKLPSERALAAQLGVGRPAVREAIKALCMLEVLDSRRGAGTFVRSLSALSEDWPLPEEPMQFEFDMVELLEVRRMLEPAAAALAAARATPAQLQELQQCLEVQARHLDDARIENQQDFQFHDVIFRAASNRVLLDVSRVLTPLLLKCRQVTGATAGAPNFTEMVRVHRLIYQAIRTSDPDTARRMMLDHLHVVGTELLAGPRRDGA